MANFGRDDLLTEMRISDTRSQQWKVAWMIRTRIRADAVPAPRESAPVLVIRYASAFALLMVAACGVSGEGRAGSLPEASEDASAVSSSSAFRDFTIVNEFPHDRRAYTQGLFVHRGVLYEGTGRNGESSLRRVELTTGKVLRQVDLARTYFGEGIALLNGSIYQLTWQARRGFVYGLEDLLRSGEFRYETEGWGLTTDGTNLVMSDGTPTLYFIDPETFEVVRTVEVRDGNGPVHKLNELEFVEGSILANVWTHEVIIEIDPETGNVEREFDFAGLVAYENAQGVDAVLNGIAYDAESKRLFVTGKLWSRVYEVALKRNDG